MLFFRGTLVNIKQAIAHTSGVGNGNLLQYGCLENPMDKEAWRATVHGVVKSWTWLNITHLTTALKWIPAQEVMRGVFGFCFNKRLPANSFRGNVYVCSVTQSCLTLCNPMDCSPPGSSVHGILQARILEWVAIPFSRGSSWHRDRICVSCIAGGFFLPESPGI